MIAAFLLGLAAQAGAQATTVPNISTHFGDIAEAIHAGRLDQARLMIARDLAAGAVGPRIERLLADLAYASGNYAEAFGRYRGLATAAKSDSLLCERAGLSAMRVGDLREAAKMIDCATRSGKGSWRSWNARGVLADRAGDWAEADVAYQHAAQLAPNEGAVANNQGWSLLLRGDWQGAVVQFERAADLDPHSTRIADNLELARAGVANDLPRRRAGESAADFAKRLNDAGMAAELLGDKERAVAAFTQALEASGTWYARAANNLDSVKSQ